MKANTKIRENDSEYSEELDKFCSFRADQINKIIWLEDGVFQAEFNNGSYLTICDEDGSLFRSISEIIDKYEELTLLELDKEISINKLEKARKNGTA